MCSDQIAAAPPSSVMNSRALPGISIGATVAGVKHHQDAKFRLADAPAEPGMTRSTSELPVCYSRASARWSWPFASSRVPAHRE
jgi:hypothetical protein